MDRVTQQNASLVEESAAAAAALEEQASRLTQSVATFRLQGNAGSKKPVAAAPTAQSPAVHTPRTPARAGDDDNWETF